jgi:hypothetical protein
VFDSQNLPDVGLTEIKGRRLLLDFLDLFRSSRKDTFEFNSIICCSRSPRRRAGRTAWPRRFVDGRGRPGHVDAADDVFLADDFSEGDDAIGNQFRVLDEVGGVTDNTGNQDLLGFTCATYGLPDMKVTLVRRKESRKSSRLSCSEKLSWRKRLHY